MTRVLHTADTHIGYRQYHSPERREDFLDAFRQVVADAVEADVDAVVHAGDVFHDRRPDVPDLLGTVAALRELADAGVPFYAVVGNHEDKRSAQWLDLFEALDLATRLDADGVAVGDVTLYGLDYVPRSRREDVDLALAAPDTEYAALVAHGQFAPLAPAVHGEAWDVTEVIETADVDLDAVLLGDEHEADTAAVAGTWVTYAGSTERTSASERDDRGYNLVTFGADAGAAAGGNGDPGVERESDPGVERESDPGVERESDPGVEREDGPGHGADGTSGDEAEGGPGVDGDGGSGVAANEREAESAPASAPAGVRIARRGLPTREFAFVDVELREGEGVERVRERVREHDLEEAVVVVTVEGDGEPVTPAEIETYASEEGALVARVNDRRELEAAAEELEVSFADPDEAVRERVRELGLSGAAREVDETVRSGDLADANVRDAVRDRVEELLDEEPDAFEPAADEGEPAPGEDDVATDALTADAPTADDSTADGDRADAGTAADAPAGEPTDDATADGVGGADDPTADGAGTIDDAGSEPAADGSGGGVDGSEPGEAGDESEPEEAGDETESEPDADSAPEVGDGADGQASMEEYL